MLLSRVQTAASQKRRTLLVFRSTVPAVLSSRSLLGCTLLLLLAGPVLATDPSLRSVFIASAVAATGGLVLLWRRDTLSMRGVLVGALVLRVAYAPLLPVLSDDMFRYVWDGWLQMRGVNPYHWTPDAKALAAWHDRPLFEKLNSASYYSVYPPLSQLVFAAGGWASTTDWQVSYFVIKGIFLALEGAGLGLLATLTTARNVLLYAWNPLVLVEVAGQAHTEAALIPFLVGAVWAVRRGAGRWASVAIAGASLVKLYPLVLGPFLLRRFGWRAVWPGALVVVAASVPYAAPYVLPHMKASVDLYAVLFEFNAGLYYAAKQGLFLLTADDWSKTLGPAFRAAFLGLLPVLYAVDAWRDWPFRTAALWTLGLFLVLSTTVHPWYLLGVLALAVLAERPAWAWVWLGACALGTYAFYTGGAYWPWVVAGWGGAALFGLRRLPPAADAVLQRVQQQRAERKADHLAPALGTYAAQTDAPLCVLDLGAGEGYVGAEIRDRYNARVHLADVVDMNRTALPFARYDGTHLPYPHDAFDVTVLVYVLHHCQDPEQVLREALRVSRRGVLVVESVYHRPLQRRVLRVLDQAANRLRSAGRMNDQEEHLHFRRPAAWDVVFATLNASVRHRKTHGSWIHPQATWWVEPPATGDEETAAPASGSAYCASPPSSS